MTWRRFLLSFACVLAALLFPRIGIAEPLSRERILRWCEEEKRLAGRSQWRGTREDQVVFPSSKAVLIDSWWYPQRTEPISPDRLIRIAFADASAAAPPERKVLPGYSRGDGSQAFIRFGHIADAPSGGLHTLNGVRGRDIAR